MTFIIFLLTIYNDNKLALLRSFQFSLRKIEKEIIKFAKIVIKLINKIYESRRREIITTGYRFRT